MVWFWTMEVERSRVTDAVEVSKMGVQFRAVTLGMSFQTQW